MQHFILLVAGATALATAANTVIPPANLPTVPDFLIQAASVSWPGLKAIAQDIYNNPELGLAEHHAHDAITGHFKRVPGWTVTPHAYGLDTSFSLVFEHRPLGYDGQLTTIGIIAEYDALVIGHACGHNHIALNAMTVASLASQALVRYNVPGRIKVVGCPDEENGAAKLKLYDAGAFDDSEVWIMAHPTASSAFQPMNSRLNLFARFTGASHQEAVKKAYQAMVAVLGLKGKLPGTASTVTNILNLGVYAVNVVQQQISLGVAGSSIAAVNQTAASVLTSKFPNVSYVLRKDTDGVAIDITGPGGHASESTQGALDLAIGVFSSLSTNSSIAFYLPGNTTSAELDVTVDLRTRYTTDIPAIAQVVDSTIGNLSSGISQDVQYPSLEVTPFLPQAIIDLLATPKYNLTDWKISNIAPASTDASWAQSAVVDPNTHELLSVNKVVVHANYRICDTAPGSLCPFNHEPLFKNLSGTEYSYKQTEIVARALSQTVLQLLANETMYELATAIIHN